MKRISISTFLMLLFNLSLIANGALKKNVESRMKNVDSLKQVLSSVSDSKKITQYAYKLITTMNRIDRDSALYYTNYYINSLEQLNDKKGKCKLQRLKANLLLLKGLNIEALNELKIVIPYYESIGDSLAVAYTSYIMASAYNNLNHYDSSVSCQFRSIRIFKKKKDKYRYARGLLDLGSTYLILKNYQEAENYFNKSVSILLEYKDAAKIARAYDGLGTIYNSYEDPDKALEYYTKALKHAKKLKNRCLLCSIYYNIGVLHQEKNEINEMIKNVKLSLKNSVDSILVLKNWNLMSKAYMDTKDYNKAQIYINKSKKYVSKHQFSKASEVIAYSYFLIANFYEQKNDIKQAFKCYKLFYDANLKYNELIKDRAVSKVEMKFAAKEAKRITEALERENQIQHLTIERNRILIFIVLLFSLLLIGGFISLNQRQKLIGQKQKAELETRLFRSQMNPHFIFNSMTAIQSFVYAHQPKEAAKYLSSFARLTRSILTCSSVEYISFNEEIDILNNYIELQRIRFENRFTYEFDIDPELEDDSFEIPPLLVQPFIENAIEYGFREESDKPGHLIIRFVLEEENVKIQVLDNGIGLNESLAFNKEKRKKHKSMATQITKERLQLLHKKKNFNTISVKDRSEINPEEHGTIVTFYVPYRF